MEHQKGIGADWIDFYSRLPSQRDANSDGMVKLLESNGTSRLGMWNWTHSAEYWRANGFTHWKPATFR